MAAKVEVSRKLSEKTWPWVDNLGAEIEPFASSLRLFCFASLPSVQVLCLTHERLKRESTHFLGEFVARGCQS